MAMGDGIDPVQLQLMMGEGDESFVGPMLRTCSQIRATVILLLQQIVV